MDNWKEQNIYLQEEDSGQPCISVKWVTNGKVVGGSCITKARLCVRGFEDLQDFPNDS